MATNPSNSTTVNIRNLPTSQLAVDSDYFILQTNNGTQIISFNDLNVVKTDINGNATITGNLTGGNASFTGDVNIASVSASRIWTTSSGRSGNGLTYDNGYYDRFTVINGIITSATPVQSVNYANPMYSSLYTQITAASASITTSITNSTQIQIQGLSAATNTQIQTLTASNNTQIQTLSANTQTQIQTLTATNQTQFKTLSGVFNTQVTLLTASSILYSGAQQFQITPGTTLYSVNWADFFNPANPTSIIPVTTIKPYMFTFSLCANTQNAQLTCVPYVPWSTIQKDVSNNLVHSVALGGAPNTTMYLYARLLVTPQ